MYLKSNSGWEPERHDALGSLGSDALGGGSHIVVEDTCIPGVAGDFNIHGQLLSQVNTIIRKRWDWCKRAVPP